MEGRAPRFLHRKPSAAAKRDYAATQLVGGSPVGQSLLKTPEAQKVAGAALALAAPKAAKTSVQLIKTLAKGAVGAVGAGASEVAAAAGVSTLAGGAAIVSVLAAAGIGSYFATRFIIDHYPTRARRLDAAADAYRKSRNDLAAKLGRPLTAAELKALADHYKAVVADINRS